jgi:hypothetical protein
MAEDYFKIQDDVLDAVGDKIKKHFDEKDILLGYQSISLGKDTKCQICKKLISRNTEAFIGFFEQSSRKIIICKKCKKSDNI